MSYDNAEVRQYAFRGIDFGGSTVAHTIQVPNGRSGRVIGVTISNVSEDFAGSSSDAGVSVGDGTTVGKYFASGLVLDETVDIADLAILELEDTGSAVKIEDGRSTVTVTFTAAAGTPTGTADATVVIAWD